MSEAYTKQGLDHLGIVSGIRWQIDLIGQIDAHKPVRIACGNFKDHRPILTQAIIGLICANNSDASPN